MPDEGDDDLMTTTEVAVRFKVDRHTVTRWIAHGLLPAIKTPGGHFRIRRRDVEEFLRRQSDDR